MNFRNIRAEWAICFVNSINQSVVKAISWQDEGGRNAASSGSGNPLCLSDGSPVLPSKPRRERESITFRRDQEGGIFLHFAYRGEEHGFGMNNDAGEMVALDRRGSYSYDFTAELGAYGNLHLGSAPVNYDVALRESGWGRKEYPEPTVADSRGADSNLYSDLRRLAQSRKDTQAVADLDALASMVLGWPETSSSTSRVLCEERP